MKVRVKATGEVFEIASYATIPMDDIWDSDNWFVLDRASFPEVTFENSPMEVELKLIEK